jgi:hypothetical protein
MDLSLRHRHRHRGHHLRRYLPNKLDNHHIDNHHDSLPHVRVRIPILHDNGVLARNDVRADRGGLRMLPDNNVRDHNELHY